MCADVNGIQSKQAERPESVKSVERWRKDEIRARLMEDDVSKRRRARLNQNGGTVQPRPVETQV